MVLRSDTRVFLVLGETNAWEKVGASVRYPTLAYTLCPPGMKYAAPAFAVYVKNCETSDLPLEVMARPSLSYVVRTLPS